MDLEDFLNIIFILVITVFILSVSYFIIKIANTPTKDLQTYRIENIKEER